MTDLVIVGVGGLGREVLLLTEAINDATPMWRTLGFVDDDPAIAGTTVNGLPVMGNVEHLLAKRSKLAVAIAVGDPRSRMAIYEKIRKNHCLDFPNLIHPAVRLSKFVSLGIGNIVCEGAILTVNIGIGNLNVINPSCTIAHDVRMGDFCTLAPGVNISGRVRLEIGCCIGTNVAVIPSVTIGEWSVLGAGAVAVRDIPPHVTAVGIPARPIKTHAQAGKPQ